MGEEPRLLLPGFGIRWGTTKALLLKGRKASLERGGVFGGFRRRQAFRPKLSAKAPGPLTPKFCLAD